MAAKGTQDESVQESAPDVQAQQEAAVSAAVAPAPAADEDGQVMVYHPSIPDVQQFVAAGRLQEWTEAGWLTDKP